MEKRLLRLFLLLLTFGLAAPLQAQQTEPGALPEPDRVPIRFDHFSVNEGLSQSTVYGIVQDHQGFMWFGTPNGLNRFDGYTFTHFKPIPFDTTSISSGYTYTLHVGPSGTLWIGGGIAVATGLNRFDRATGTFTRFMHDPTDSTSLISNSVSAIFEEQSGMLWVGSWGHGMSRMNLDRPGHFTYFKHDPSDSTSLSSKGVFDIFGDRSGVVWVATENGLNRLERETGRFTQYFNGPSDFAGRSIDYRHRLRRIYEDTETPGVLWIGSDNGLVRFDTRTGVHQHYLATPDDAQRIIVSGTVADPIDSGILWVATVRHGLFRFDKRTGGHTRYTYTPDDPTSLSRNALRSIYTDKTGSIWMGTDVAGVNKFDPSAGGFTRIAPEAPPSYNGVYGLLEDRAGRLWIGTWGSEKGAARLTRLDRRTGKRTYWQSQGTVNSLYEDAAGIIWMGIGDDLMRMDPETERLTQSYENHGLIRAFLEDRAGRLWIGSEMGITRMDREKNTFSWYRADPHDPTGLSHPLIRAFLEDRAGTFWVATEGGLKRMDRQTGIFEHFLHDPDDPTSLSHNYVTSLYEDRTGTLWVGTLQGGLNRMDRQTGTFIHYTEQGVLPDNTIYMILEDEAGSLWLSTNHGLSRFDPRTETARNFDVDDGLPVNEFNSQAAFKSPRTGEMFFGDIEGVVAFYPDRFETNPHPPLVTISGFKLFNEPVTVGEGALLTKAIEETEEIRLKHNEHSISFDYVALHYKDSEQNRYRYRLEPLEAAWVEAGARRTANYTHLDPGDYVFRVTASNSDGVWNEEGASVRITILQPWWQVWWVRVLAFVVAAGLVYGGYRRRVRSLEARSRMLEAQVAERTAELEARNEQLRVHEAQLETTNEQLRWNEVQLERQAQTLWEQTKQLLELEQTKDRFFANISHEFRTPLTLILGPLHDTLNGTYGSVSPLLQRQLEIMRRSARRLHRLIGQLLDLSRLDVGRMQLRARRRNLIPFLKGIILSFSAMAERRCVTLQFMAETEALPLYFDADKLEKIVTNLLSNAFKFTPEQGNVRVSVREAADAGKRYAEIRVRDTGLGIPAEEAQRIFDRFHQVDASSTRKNGGTGIGLALAKELVALHGGFIKVESEMGFGCEFTVCLPLGKAHLAPTDLVEEDTDEEPDGATVASASWLDELESSLSEADLAETPGEVHPSARTILIVEDNADVRLYLKDHLGALYHLVEAADGVEGLEKARAVVPDLVISDVMMPRMDGYALCRAIKQDEHLNHIPVVLLTAKASEEAELEGLQTGCDDYIYKPFSAEVLLARVENLIEIRRLLRQRFSEEVVVQPSGVSVPSEEAVFLERVQEAVEAHLGDSNFTVEWLADEVGLSPRHLGRRLKAATRLSPSGFIRMMRLKRAAQLLEQQAGTVAEVAYAVGYDAKHFSRLFFQTFGVHPSAYRADQI